jgi:ribosome-associated toxin RatA of RatAB toxin-antitoxin module
VPVYSATREIDVPTSPPTCFAVLTDYEHLPEWQSRVVECRVLERGDDGLATEVEYAIDAVLRTIRYRLRHLYRAPEWIGSQYVGGDLRRFEGEYRFHERNGGTHVEFALSIDPGLRVPGRIARELNERVMGRSLEDLRRRVAKVRDGTAPDADSFDT